MKITKECAVCKKEFYPYRTTQKFCSPECYRSSKTFIDACKKHSPYNTGKHVVCAYCGCNIYRSPARLKNSKHFFCSLKCLNTWNNGRHNFNYGNKSRRAKSRKSLDAKWRLIALERAKYKCEYCGSTEHLNVHHVIGRRNLSTRWYLPNAVVLCVKHHMFDTHMSAHQNSFAFIQWIVEKRGQAWKEDLFSRGNEVLCRWQDHLDELNDHLEEQLLEIVNERS